MRNKSRSIGSILTGAAKFIIDLKFDIFTGG